jgi:hypothetical protein
MDALRQEAGIYLNINYGDTLLEGVNVYKSQRDEFESKLQMQLKEQSSIQVRNFEFDF